MRAGKAKPRAARASRAQPSTPTPAAAPVPPPVAVSAAAIAVDLGPGLFALTIAVAEPPDRTGAVALPLISVAQLPAAGGEPLVILSAAGLNQRWLDRNGGIVVVRAPAGGGQMLVTVFGPADREPAAPRIEVRPLDRVMADGAVAVAPRAVAAPVGRDVGFDILLHMERLGDRTFPGEGWVGNRGQRVRIEGFGITPRGGEIAAGDIEYKGFDQRGAETPWTKGPQFCGSRGRGLALTGFAVRLARRLEGRFAALYQGSFFSSGVGVPSRDGEPCRARLAGDSLEAIHLRIVETRRE